MYREVDLIYPYFHSIRRLNAARLSEGLPILRMEFEDQVDVFLQALSTKQPVELSISSNALNDDVIASAFTTGWSPDSTVEDLGIKSCGMITSRTLKLLANLRR